MIVRSFSRIVAFVLVLAGDMLIITSLYLPWFTFAGTAEHALGTVWVSGSVSAFGIGAIDTSARITMWSSTFWSTSGSDFWFGYLSVVGVLLISAPLLVELYRFAKKEKQEISELLVFIAVIAVGCSLVASASLISLLYYHPYTFVIFGQIYNAPPTIDSALLHASQATVRNGMGPWLSIVGAFPCIIGAVFQAYCAETRQEVRTRMQKESQLP